MEPGEGNQIVHQYTEEFNDRPTADELLHAIDKTAVYSQAADYENKSAYLGSISWRSLVDVAAQVALSGDLPGALELLRFNPTHSADEALIYASRGLNFAREGQATFAKSDFEKALKLLASDRRSGEEGSYEFLNCQARVALLHAEAGLTKESMEIIEGMGTTTHEKSKVLADIADIRAEADPEQAEDFFTSAQVMALEAGPDPASAVAIRYLIANELEAGRFDRARDSVQYLKDPDEREKMMHTIDSTPKSKIGTTWEREIFAGTKVVEAVKLAESGRIEEAVQKTMALEPEDQTLTLAEVAWNAANQGYNDRALEICNQVKLNMKISSVERRELAALALAEVKAGGLIAAVDDLKKLSKYFLTNDELGKELLKNIVEELIRQGDVATVQTISDSFNDLQVVTRHRDTGSLLRPKYEAYGMQRRIIEERAALGDFEGANKSMLTQTISSRLGLTAALLKGLARQEGLGEAREQLEEAGALTHIQEFDRGKNADIVFGERSLNVVPLLEIAGGRPDRILSITRFIRSYEHFRGVCKALDRSEKLDAAELAAIAATMLASISALSLKSDWELLARDEMKDAKPAVKRRLGRSIKKTERLLEADIDKELLDDLLNKGYKLTDLLDYPWLATREVAKMEEPFPVTKGLAEQDRWLVRNSFANLGGFNQRSMGRLIRNQLETGQVNNVHDATFWLRGFTIPEKAPDIARIKRSEAGRIEDAVLIDHELEAAFLVAVWEGRGNLDHLPRKPQRYNELFNSRTNALIYRALLEELSQGEGAEEQQLRLDRIRNRILGYLQDEFEADADKEDMMVSVDHRLSTSIESKDSFKEQKSSEVIFDELRAISLNRKAYVDDVISWLEANQNGSKERLIRVWGDRPAALREGIPDQVAAIEQWAKENAVRNLAQELADDGVIEVWSPFEEEVWAPFDEGSVTGPDSKYTITEDELTTTYRPYVTELSKRYDAESTIAAVAWLKHKLNEETHFPAQRIDIGDGHIFEVIPKDDPRGFTVGVDTACCMTIGGASEECIAAFYTDPRYGLGVIYAPDGTLLAQALMYTDPDRSTKTLVLDNIEHNEGRDTTRLIELYRSGFKKYFEKETLPFRRVDLGLGYLELSVEGYPEVQDPVPTPLDIYTDAEEQVRILDLPSRTEAPSLGNLALSANNPVEVFAHVTVHDVEKLAEMERAIYPAALRVGAHSFAFSLNVSSDDNFSFFIQPEGESEPIGYMVATRDHHDRQYVYIADLAIIPERQREGWGSQAMVQLFSRLENTDVNTIKFEARASTSYRALRSPAAQEALKAIGWAVAEEKLMAGYYYSQEDAYNIKLQRIQR